MIKLLILIACSFFLVGCCPCRKVQQTDVQRDSVRVEYRVQTIVEHDTAYVSLPPQTAERETRDSVSYLHNDYAESTARITLGILYHDLRLKSKPIAVPTEKVIEYRDSIIYQDREHVKTETIEVKKPLGWFAKFQMIGFWVLLLILIFVFRKPIMKLFGL